ncbi:hypothetical protein GCM10009665_07100 [Kitasatospora nipponensis]|uniref:Uncharacterized protein n=1 Tax=Kitasatospora nipponensis TaxID=258049 RepID=A0ABP4GB51_9ACTN
MDLVRSDTTMWTAIGATALDFGAVIALLLALAALLFPSARRAPTGAGPGRLLLALLLTAGAVASVAWTIAHS